MPVRVKKRPIVELHPLKKGEAVTRYCAWKFSNEEDQLNAYEEMVWKMGRQTVFGSVYRLMTLIPGDDDFSYIVALVVDDRDSHRKVKRQKLTGGHRIELDDDIIDILTERREVCAPDSPGVAVRIEHTV